MAQIAEIIKYEGDNNTFIWKHPCEDFNTTTQLIVHESQEDIKKASLARRLFILVEPRGVVLEFCKAKSANSKADALQNSSVTVRKTTHCVVLLTAFDSPHDTVKPK